MCVGIGSGGRLEGARVQVSDTSQQLHFRLCRKAKSMPKLMVVELRLIQLLTIVVPCHNK